MSKIQHLNFQILLTTTAAVEAVLDGISQAIHQ